MLGLYSFSARGRLLCHALSLNAALLYFHESINEKVVMSQVGNKLARIHHCCHGYLVPIRLCYRLTISTWVLTYYRWQVYATAVWHFVAKLLSVPCFVGNFPVVRWSLLMLSHNSSGDDSAFCKLVVRFSKL